MATQYTSILKLALPTEGELSGTWGDVVNDNITSMVEEAIAGRAVINTWTANSHTLTTADGLTSEARCAMLEFTDTGTALTGAGTVICPTASKIYVVKNASGQAVTLTTAAGTGIQVPDSETMFLFCDGTNVIEAVTSVKTLKIADGTQVNTILDEDNMASDSATALATQQSIKAYVDAQIGSNNELSEVLSNGNTSGGTSIQLTTTDEVQFRDTALKIYSSADGQLDIDADTELEITAPTVDIDASTEVNISNAAKVGGTLSVDTVGELTPDAGVTVDSVLLKDDSVNATTVETTNLKANDGTAAVTVADSTGVVTVSTSVKVDTINEVTAAGGVTIDSVLLKDSRAQVAGIDASDGTTAINIADSTGAVDIDTSLDVDNININGNAITSTDTNGNIALTPDGTGEVDISKVDIDGGAIDDTVIGGTTPAAGTFTDVTAGGTIDFTGATVSDLGSVTTADINGGTVDGTDITVGSGKTLDVSGGTLTLANDQISGDSIEGGTIGSTTISSLTSSEVDLSAIDTSIADTAVDVFIYDTRKDSDGGAWRKRTQNTSWYNETLNTATRGSRREFPAVAVIVAEVQQVTIYDGDDPDMPMWMVFNTSSAGDAYDTHFLGRSTIGDMTSVVMRNGKMAIGRAYTSTFVEAYTEIDFIKEEALHRAANSHPFNNPAIVNRNGQAGGYGSINSGGIVNVVAVNDVAMTVLPNAPIDSATGLPIPTIAVATNGGVSVIKDDGTVVDGPDASNLESHFIDFTSDNEVLSGLYYELSPFNYSQAARYYIPSADKSSWATPSTIAYDYNGNGNVYPWPGTDQTWQLRALATSGNRDYLGSVQLLTIADVDEYDPQNNSMLAYITSSYNTGWMNGDIKLATLSDTDDTDVTGSELVTNGTFDSGTTGWTSYNSTLSVVSGALRVADNGAYSKAYQSITTEIGKKYVFTVSVIALTGGNAVISIGDNAPNVDDWNDSINTRSSSGALTVNYTATSTTTYIELGSEGTASVDYDNVSVRLAEEDRSVNNNGLQVFGTVTKNPVATGADLVAYSGFSASNYLRQPYNADLLSTINADNITYMMWLNSSGPSTTEILMGAEDSSIGEFLQLIAHADDTISWYLDTNTYTQLFSSTSVCTGNWRFVVATYDGTNARLYVDGSLNASATTTHNSFNMGSSYTFTIGRRLADTYPATSSKMSLLRVSSTIPSPEQIKKIYEDEKFLFQENAQATLYGSSDAVTALAYDDSTDLLHAGTSEGRSVFQGLRRVDNTTDAVGSAISASNGMVADD